MAAIKTHPALTGDSNQGIDTRKLLGHRRQSMTDAYNSTRRLREWVTIPLESKK
jgi:hypothetical protein